MNAIENKERQERIKVLKREMKRSTMLPSLLTSLSEITHRDLNEADVISLEHIDRLVVLRNSSDFDFNYLTISYPIEKANNLSELLASLKGDLTVPAYLSFSHTSEIIMFDVIPDFVIGSFELLIKIDGDTITLCDHDYKRGFNIDLYNEWWYLDGEAKLRSIYELKVFGKDWIKKIAAAL